MSTFVAKPFLLKRHYNVDFSLQNEYLQVCPLVPRGDDKTENTSPKKNLTIQFPCRHVDFRRHHTCRFCNFSCVTSRSSRGRQNGKYLTKKNLNIQLPCRHVDFRRHHNVDFSLQNEYLQV